MNKAIIYFAIYLNLFNPLIGLSSILEHQKLDTLNNEITLLQQKIDNAKDKHDTLLEELSETESHISLLDNALEAINVKLNTLPKKIATLQDRIQSNKSELEKNQMILGKQIHVAYVSGYQDFLKLLLQEENVERFSRLIKYYQSMNNARYDLVKTIQKKYAELQADEKMIQEEKNQLQKLRRDSLLKQKALASSKRYREIVIKEIHSELSSDQSKLTQLQRDKMSLEKVIKKLEKSYETNHQLLFASMQGQLNYPTQGKVTKQFGQTILNSQLTHNGLFIDSAKGTKVSAIYSGTIVFSDWLRGFGLVLIIDHGDGYMSLYAHNDKLYKHAGELVSTNEVIAIVGHTGAQTKTGLYFEIRHDGQALNPADWINTQVA